jgi:putative DNA primase/helicase
MLPEAKNLPLEMRLARRWVVWRLEERGGKATKVPYRPDGRGRASSTDPATWGGLYEALARAQEGYDGVGFVLGGGFAGVDLDAALEEGRPLPWAEEVLALLPGPVEVSPSGRGLHVYLRVGGPVAGRRRSLEGGGLEVYGEGRFFTVTGRWLRPALLPSPEEGLAALKALEERFFPPPPPARPRPLPSTPPEKSLEDFLARTGHLDLWRGEWRGRYPSQSEADLALAGLLLRFTGGDVEEADRLFRQSGLYRPKWDERRGELTYGERTLRRAQNT